MTVTRRHFESGTNTVDAPRNLQQHVIDRSAHGDNQGHGHEHDELGQLEVANVCVPHSSNRSLTCTRI